MRLERAADGPALGAWFGGVLVVGAGLAAFWLHLGLPTPVCLFREWTGIPCPTCGATRMVAALLSGDVVVAAAWNPMLFLALVAVAGWAVASSVRLAFGLPAWRVALARRERVGLRLMACGAVAVSWAYQWGQVFVGR
jgi:hypothetical protein